jgi:phage baseplate assembly protein W
MARRLAQERYLTFPLSLEGGTPRTSTRAEHIREQILQTLFTGPRERVFRPTFGAGAQQLVFEPNETGLGAVTIQRISGALAEVLAGEVDPKTLNVEVAQDEETLVIRVSYQIAALSQREAYEFVISEAGLNG